MSDRSRERAVRKQSEYRRENPYKIDLILTTMAALGVTAINTIVDFENSMDTLMDVGMYFSYLTLTLAVGNNVRRLFYKELN